VLADVRYALDAVGQFLYDLRLHAPPLAGKTVLEVGPGINYGGVMGLACYGMVPLVADRYLAPWDGAYHPRFYTLLADELSRGDPAADVRPLRALVDHGGYDDRIIRRVAEPLEELSLPTGSVDVIFSNAVLEHLFDLERSFTQLFRVTKPGGLGLHQVDFRDHCNFSRPLEYLLLGEGEFQRLFTEWHSECGNRYRAGEFQAVLEECGFEVLLFSANQHADPEYMADFLPRLRAARGSRYCDKPEKELVELSGYFRLRKPC
jgi:SAM-dependent methyltransferase